LETLAKSRAEKKASQNIQKIKFADSMAIQPALMTRQSAHRRENAIVFEFVISTLALAY
jgi:hypothetical protein